MKCNHSPKEGGGIPKYNSAEDAKKGVDITNSVALFLLFFQFKHSSSRKISSTFILPIFCVYPSTLIFVFHIADFEDNVQVFTIFVRKSSLTYMYVIIYHLLKLARHIGFSRISPFLSFSLPPSPRRKDGERFNCARARWYQPRFYARRWEEDAIVWLRKMTGGGGREWKFWVGVGPSRQWGIQARHCADRQLRYPRQTRNHRRYRRSRSDYVNNKKRDDREREKERRGGEREIGRTKG